MARIPSEIQERMTAHFLRLGRSFEAMGDAARIATDAFIRADRKEWEYPDLVLSDEDRDELEARQLRRLLADIDSLPEVEKD